MKALLIAFLLVFSANLALADDDSCLNSCKTAITVDSGNTGSSCRVTFANKCNCILQAAGRCYSMVAGNSNCPSGYTSFGNTIDGDKCCIDTDTLCLASGETAPVEKIVETESSREIANIFEASSKSLAFGYWGVVNDVVRSPSSGRGNSAHAKLDACLFYSDVDNLGTGYTGWDTCKNSTTLGCNASNKNEYCMNNGASVCEDRCDCVFTGFSTCDGL